MIVGHVNLVKGFRGGERQTELLVRELSERGIEQRLIARKGSALTPRLEGLPGLTIKEIGFPYFLHASEAKGCDLIHAHEAKAAQYALFVRKLFGIPYVITRRVLKTPKNNFFTRAVYTNASRVTALSKAIRKNLLRYMPGLDITIIPSMAASLQVAPDEVARIREQFAGKFVVGHVGALVNSDKGQQYLIDAARNLSDDYPSMHFVFLGEGPDKQLFNEQAKGLSNISFIGFVDNVGDYLQVFDLFVFPSLKEGLGSVLIDVMDSKTPIVASNVGGIPDLVRHEKNGLLVPPRDGDALSTEIVRLFNDQSLREKLSQQAKLDAQLLFPPEITKRYLRDVYSSNNTNSELV